MTQTRFHVLGLRALALTAVLAGLVSSVSAEDARTRTPAPVVAGVALHDGGVLYGQLLDDQKQPVANEEVRILSQGRLIIAVKTNAQGQFGVRGLRAGAHTIESTKSRQLVQLWAPRTAPPSAHKVAVVVAGKEPVAAAPILRAQGTSDYGPAIRGAVAGGLITGFTYWALDYNPTGS